MHHAPCTGLRSLTLSGNISNIQPSIHLSHLPGTSIAPSAPSIGQINGEVDTTLTIGLSCTVQTAEKMTGLTNLQSDGISVKPLNGRTHPFRVTGAPSAGREYGRSEFLKYSRTVAADVSRFDSALGHEQET